MTKQMELTPQVVDNAIAVLLTDGWTQGAYGTLKGPKCVSGAINVALGLKPDDPTPFFVSHTLTELARDYTESDTFLESLNDRVFISVEDAVDFLNCVYDYLSD